MVLPTTTRSHVYYRSPVFRCVFFCSYRATDYVGKGTTFYIHNALSDTYRSRLVNTYVYVARKVTEGIYIRDVFTPVCVYVYQIRDVLGLRY